MKNPIISTPGATFEYTINSGYIAFSSAESSWSNIVEQTQFANTIKFHSEWSIRGLRSDYIISVIPDLDITTKNAFFLHFNDEFLPQLSVYNPYTYLDMDNKRYSIKVHNQSPRT